MHRYGMPVLRLADAPTSAAQPDLPRPATWLPDPQLLAFLRARVLEEIPGARQRRAAAGADPDAADRAVRVLAEPADLLRSPQNAESMIVRMLVLAYREHPEFRPEWQSYLRP